MRDWWTLFKSLRLNYRSYNFSHLSGKMRLSITHNQSFRNFTVFKTYALQCINGLCSSFIHNSVAEYHITIQIASLSQGSMICPQRQSIHTPCTSVCVFCVEMALTVRWPCNSFCSTRIEKSLTLNNTVMVNHRDRYQAKHSNEAT